MTRSKRAYRMLPIVLLLTVACEAQESEQQYEEEHASHDFPAVVDGQEQILTYEGTHDVVPEEDPDVKLVVFVHHGGAQNPVTYFENAMAALEEADADRPELDLAGTTMVLAPAMIGEDHIADDPDRYADGHYAYWPGGWREGATSASDPPVSNFDLLDALVLHVADEFPGVQAIVHIGHSAGGQLLSRYSLGTTVYDSLREREIFSRYVIANPSSVVYFDSRRPDLDADEGFVDYSDRTPVVDGEECPEFDHYKYGFGAEVDEYMTRRPLSQMTADFRDREVHLLQGLEDNDPEHGSLDDSCPGMVQGRHRLERGRRYYEYLGEFFGPEVYETTTIQLVPGVGHSNGRMWASEPGKDLIFIDADSARAANFGES